jgi:hypothetical protein
MVKYGGDKEVKKNRHWDGPVVGALNNQKGGWEAMQWHEDKEGLGSRERGVKEGPDQQDHNNHVG